MNRAPLSAVTFALLLAIGLPRARAEQPIPASGNVTTSHEHFNRGVEYVHDGDLKGALIEFKRAYAASPNYRVLYNLGQVANAIGKYVEAQSYFQRYLNDGAEDIAIDRRHDVEMQLAKLEGRIATLQITTNVPGAEVFIDDVSVGTSPLALPVRVSSGTRTITATVSGRPRVSQVIEVAGGDTVPLRLQFAPAPKEPAPVASLPAPLLKKTDFSEPEASGGNAVLWLGLTSGALAIGTGVMGYLTVRDAQRYDDAVGRKTTARELNDLDSRASTKALVTDVLLGATAVSAAITLIVALQNHKHERKPNDHPPHSNTELSVGAGALHLNSQF